MKRTILAALFLGATTTIAAAQATTAQGVQPGEVSIVYDASLADKFEVKREIVERAQEIWGETAAYETPQELPPSINQAIVPGGMMPADTPVEPVPAAMGDLPTLMDGGSRWVAAGNHLVEVAEDGTIVMVVYNALP